MAIDGRFWLVLSLLVVAWMGTQSFLQIGHNIGVNGVNATAPSGPPTINGYPSLDGFMTDMGLGTFQHPGPQTVTGWVQSGAKFRMTVVGYEMCVNPPGIFYHRSKAGHTIMELDSKTSVPELATVTVVPTGHC